MSPFSKLLAVSALTLVAAAAQAAPVGQPVTIEESAIPGAAANQIVVDQLSGQYDEVVSVSPTNLSGTVGNFVTEAIFNAGNWFNSGSPADTQVNAFGAAGYGLYAKFSQKGTYSFNPVTTTFTFTGFSAGTLELWADPNKNTNYDVKSSATGDIANLNLVSGAASVTDDLLLGSASTVAIGGGSSTAGLANGNFEIIFSDFGLANPNGVNYFIQPRPFYMLLDVNGNFQSFNPLTQTDSVLLNNSANAFFFRVPEPGALGLVGLAMLGLGLFTRRTVRK